MNMKKWNFAMTRAAFLVVSLMVALWGASRPAMAQGTSQKPGPSTASQVAVAGGTQMTFSRIVVSGNQRIETPTVLRYADIPRGQPVTLGQLDEAYRRLVATGLFEKVSLKPQGARLVIAVREYPTINRISFEGNKRIKDDALAKVIRSQPRKVYNPAEAEADAGRVIAAYRQAGRLNAQVTPCAFRRPA